MLRGGRSFELPWSLVYLWPGVFVFVSYTHIFLYTASLSRLSLTSSPVIQSEVFLYVQFSKVTEMEITLFVLYRMKNNFSLGQDPLF